MAWVRCRRHGAAVPPKRQRLEGGRARVHAHVQDLLQDRDGEDGGGLRRDRGITGGRGGGQGHLRARDHARGSALPQGRRLDHEAVPVRARVRGLEDEQDQEREHRRAERHEHVRGDERV